MTLIAGTDVSCGAEHKKALKNAVEQGLISEDIIDRAAIRALTSRFRLGLFDDADKVKYNKLTGFSTEEMHAASVDMANDTIVLLKNEDGLLPIRRDKVKSILVVGPNAFRRQLGGYSAGQTPIVDTPVNVMALDGIRKEAGDDMEVLFEKGWTTDEERGAKGIEDILPGFDPEEILMDISPEMMAGFMGEKPPKRHVPEDPDLNADDDMLIARAGGSCKEG